MDLDKAFGSEGDATTKEVVANKARFIMGQTYNFFLLSSYSNPIDIQIDDVLGPSPWHFPGVYG